MHPCSIKNVDTRRSLFSEICNCKISFHGKECMITSFIHKKCQIARSSKQNRWNEWNVIFSSFEFIKVTFFIIRYHKKIYTTSIKILCKTNFINMCISKISKSMFHANLHLIISFSLIQLFFISCLFFSSIYTIHLHHKTTE